MGNSDDEPSVWLLLTIPITSAVVGYLTNVLALKMTLHPIEFWGIECKRWEDQPIGLFGWQGIIPCKAGKLAGDACDLITDKLLDVQQMFARLTPEGFTAALRPGMHVALEEIVGEVASTHAPSVWSRLPAALKAEVLDRAMEQVPVFSQGMLTELAADVHRVFDIRDMVVTAIDRDKAILNDIFLECGRQEFRFIERSGFVFGFLFGLVQLLIFAFYNASWVLPVFGFVVGFATNYIALFMIFKPQEPNIICCGRYTWQGVFLKRQLEVSEVFARVQTQHILNSAHIWHSLLNGARSAEFHAMLRRHSIAYAERFMGAVRPLAELYLGQDGYTSLLASVADKVVEKLPMHLHHVHEYTDRAMDIERTIREAMQDLPPREFEGVLHPAFEQDEIKLILVGGVLGCIVGILQIFLVFV